jgi:hypothetical protein
MVDKKDEKEVKLVEVLKLKKKNRKLLTGLWKTLKTLDSSIVKTITDQLGGKVTEVTQEDIVDFKVKLSEKQLETFEAHDKMTQDKVVAKSKENTEFMSSLIGLADVIVSEYDSIEEEIDAIVLAATNQSAEDIEEMDFDEYIKLIIKVVKLNLNFLSMLK